MGWQADWDADQRAEAKYREWAEAEKAKGNVAKGVHWDRVADGIARRGEDRRTESPPSGGLLGCGLMLLPRVLALPVVLLYRKWTKQ